MCSPRGDIERPCLSLDDPVLGIQDGQAPQMFQGTPRVTQPERTLDGDPQRGLVVRLALHEPLDLRAGLRQLALIEEGLGQDQARRGVLGKTRQALTTQPDGVARLASPSMGLGERCVRLGGRLPGQPALVVADLVTGRQGTVPLDSGKPERLYRGSTDVVNDRTRQKARRTGPLRPG